MVVLGGRAASYERGTPVPARVSQSASDLRGNHLQRYRLLPENQGQTLPVPVLCVPDLSTAGVVARVSGYVPLHTAGIFLNPSSDVGVIFDPHQVAGP